jgi:hypothetical protein
MLKGGGMDRWRATKRKESERDRERERAGDRSEPRAQAGAHMCNGPWVWVLMGFDVRI